MDRSNGEVVPDCVVGFNAIFDKEVVALDLVSHVFFNCQVVNSVDGCHSGEGVVDCVSSDIGSRDIAGHVEMDAISSHNLGLTAVHKLSVGNMTLESID